MSLRPADCHGVGSPRMSLLAELRRRNVIRIAGLYLVGAWLITQVAGTVLPMFDAPAWFPRSVVLVLAIGFVPALIFAWVFEITPDGLKRDSEVMPGTSIAPLTGRRIDRVIIAVLVLAVIYFGFDKFVLAPRRAATQAPATVNSTAAAPGTTEASTITSQSIAVLPFENLSADPDNAFFANGIQDEILTGLAKIAGLKVISRTSTLRYQSRPPNLLEIARELGVANILEGSVQKAGNRVRVNVQLIDARSDSHLWAETYDRDLQDIFAVQSEIAQKIAESLQTTLTRDERASLSIRPTHNTDAYESYLRARSLILETSSYDRVTVDRGVEALETAVALDPEFALAWAELAQQHVWAYFSGFESTSAHFARATTALERAESLGPTLPQVAMARGFYLYYGLHDFPAALAVVRKAQRSLPNDARAWYLSALLGRRLGQWESSDADFQRARELSPNDYSITSELGLSLFVQRRYKDALPMVDAALALQPDDPAMLHTKLQCLWSLEGLAGGARLLDEIKSASPTVLALRGTQAWYQRDAARAAELLRRAVATDAEGTVLPNYLAGYVPARIEWELLLASVEQQGDPAAAGKRYRGLLAMAEAGLAKPSTPYIEAAWRVVRGRSLSALGQRAEAAAEGRRAAASVPASGDALEGPVWEDYLAEIHAMNGDAAQAVPLISRQLRMKGSLITPMLLRVDPIWDRIRTDPGFKALAGEQR